jgi:hypothetical protein
VCLICDVPWLLERALLLGYADEAQGAGAGGAFGSGDVTEAVEVGAAIFGEAGGLEVPAAHPVTDRGSGDGC